MVFALMISSSSGFADRCYSDTTSENGITVDIESPCEKIILHPTKVVGTTKGIYVLTDNGRVYFSSDSDLVDADGIVTVFNKFHRVKSYPEERNSTVPVGVGPWGIVDIVANPNSKFAYLLDRDGHLFVVGPPGSTDPEKAHGGVAKEILIDKTTSYKIKNFNISKDSSDDYFYIVFEYIKDKIDTRVRIFKISTTDSTTISNVVGKITDIVENDECSTCIIDFVADAEEGKFYRIADIKISSEIAVAEINQYLAVDQVTPPPTESDIKFAYKTFDESKYTQYEVLKNSNFIARDNDGKWNIYDDIVSPSTLSPVNSNISDGKTFVYTGDNNLFDIDVDPLISNGSRVCKHSIDLSTTPTCLTIPADLMLDPVRHIAQYKTNYAIIVTDNSILRQTLSNINTQSMVIQNYQIKEINPVTGINPNKCEN